MDSLSSQYSLKPPVGDKTPTRWKNEGWESGRFLYILIYELLAQFKTGYD